MWTETACRALSEGKVLDVHYQGFSRSVEVHCVGRTRYGHPIIRAWQIADDLIGKERRGWKLIRLDQVVGVSIEASRSAAPRRGYRRGDAAMARIICEL
jgi:hypothetical protein